MDALDEKIGGGLFKDDAASTEAHGANHVAIIFRSGEDHHASRQGIEIDFFENSQAVFIGHAEVEKKDIGLELGEHLDAFGAVLGFADNGNVLVGIEELAETIAKNRVIIREEDTNLLFGL